MDAGDKRCVEVSRRARTLLCPHAPRKSSLEDERKNWVESCSLEPEGGWKKLFRYPAFSSHLNAGKQCGFNEYSALP